jgi:hypothetical protein
MPLYVGLHQVGKNVWYFGRTTNGAAGLNEPTMAPERGHCERQVLKGFYEA